MDLDDMDSDEVAESENEEIWDPGEEDEGQDDEGFAMDDREIDEPDEYCFQFEREIDPVDIVEADAIEMEPYLLFERLEYEALAEKKRKSLNQNQG